MKENFYLIVSGLIEGGD